MTYHVVTDWEVDICNFFDPSNANKPVCAAAEADYPQPANGNELEGKAEA